MIRSRPRMTGTARLPRRLIRADRRRAPSMATAASGAVCVPGTRGARMGPAWRARPCHMKGAVRRRALPKRASSQRRGSNVCSSSRSLSSRGSSANHHGAFWEGNAGSEAWSGLAPANVSGRSACSKSLRRLQRPAGGPCFGSSVQEQTPGQRRAVGRRLTNGGPVAVTTQNNRRKSAFPADLVLAAATLWWWSHWSTG